MITIGVPAYREPLIKRCLKALVSEKIRKEIIVVTPDEETAKLAGEFKGVRVIKEKKREGKPAAVNRILKEARGDIIVLTDADVVIMKGAVSKLIRPLKDKSVSVVCGHPVVEKQKGMLGYWGRVLYDIVHKQRLGGAAHLTTNLCAFRKGCVKKIPKNALIDDYVIGMECLKKGKMAYAPDAKVLVKFPATISDFLKQRTRTFAGYMQVKEWYGKSERSFGNEIKDAGSVFSYIKSPKQFFWIALLAFFRLIAWAKAFVSYRKRKKLTELWKPASSTKRLFTN